MRLVDDFKVDGLWVQSKVVDGERLVTRAGRLWGSINTRTKVDGSFKRCHKASEQSQNGFKDFQSFAEWCNGQTNYNYIDLEGKKYELDKDIKGKGDKWYSPGNCSFVPQHINKLLNEQRSRVGDLPLGVSFHKKSGKYSARVSSFNRRIWLGLYDTPEEAHIEYKSAKALEIIRLLRYYEEHLDSTVVFELYRRAVNHQ